MTPPRWFYRQTRFRLLSPCGSEHPIQVRLGWSPDLQPDKIYVSFPSTFGPVVTWVISRDLLIVGYHAPVAQDDVTVLPDLADQRYLELYLSGEVEGQDQTMGFKVWRESLKAFLLLTLQHRPISTPQEAGK